MWDTYLKPELKSGLFPEFISDDIPEQESEIVEDYLALAASVMKGWIGDPVSFFVLLTPGRSGE